MAAPRAGTSSGGARIKPGTPGRRLPVVVPMACVAASDTGAPTRGAFAGVTTAVSAESRVCANAASATAAATTMMRPMAQARRAGHERNATASSGARSAFGATNGAAADVGTGWLGLISCTGKLGTCVHAGNGGGCAGELGSSELSGWPTSKGASTDGGVPSDINVALRRPLLAGALLGERDSGGRESALNSVENGERCGALREAGRVEGAGVARTEGGGVSERAGPSGASVELRRELGTATAGKVELREGTGR